MHKRTIKSKITRALRKGVAAAKADIDALLLSAFTAGKMHEAFILAVVCRNLKNLEGCAVTLVGSRKVALKSSPGPINPSYPHFRVSRNGRHFADIWTDIEFSALSAHLTRKAPLQLGDYHEIDIAVVEPGLEREAPPAADLSRS